MGGMDTIDERSAWVRTVVERDFGVRLVDFLPIIGGLDHGAQVWFATDVAGAPWSVKA